MRSNAVMSIKMDISPDADVVRYTGYIGSYDLEGFTVWKEGQVVIEYGG